MKLRRILAVALIVAGLLVIVRGLTGSRAAEWRLDVIREAPGTAVDPKVLPTRLPIESVTIYRISPPAAATARVAVYGYRDNAGAGRSALFWLPEQAPGSSAVENLVPPASDARFRIWLEAAALLRERAEPDALVMAWWDNAQRVRLLTGLETWISQPAGASFVHAGERALWQKLSGGFGDPSPVNHDLADLLTRDPVTAALRLRELIGSKRPVYFLVTVDDLLRLSELNALGGGRIEVESKSFPMGAEIHSAISRVKEWGAARNARSYLVQQSSPDSVRAWSVIKGADSLLVRLLPFSASMADPLKDFELVYQSDWGAYLQIYRWRADG